MDFTPLLSAFQGVIISADNINSFSRLTEKGGNEEKINSVISNILRFLHDQKIIDNGLVNNMVPQARIFALYIILNANLRTLEELIDKEEIDLVIWTIPTIPKLLMCEFIYNFHMEQFLYEVVVFTYPPLAVEVSAAFIDHLKYSNPVSCLDKLRQLSIACYTLMCRLHLFHFGQNHSKILIEASNNFQKCVKYFIDPPNSDHVIGKNDYYKYKAESLICALLFVYECLNQFTSIHEKTPSGIDDIYQLTYLADRIKQDITSYQVIDCPQDIIDLLNKSNEIMLDAIKKLVMDVNVDIFCAWSEFEKEGKTMQQIIGELCYKVRTKLLSISSVSEHPIVNMMEQIARKPADINDMINSTDVAIIIEKINSNNAVGQLWLQALINKDQLCRHTELLEVINSNFERYNEEQCHNLYEVLKHSPENKEYTHKLAVKAFHRCNVSTKYELLDKHFSENCFIDMPESAEFEQMMIETFNKLIKQPDADVSDVLTLFLQNPRQVYYKLFNLALENSQQTDIMLKVMQVLEKYSNYHYETEIEPCIIKVAQDIFERDLDTDMMLNNFIKFVCGLKDIHVIPAQKLLLLLIMPHMHTALLSENISSLNIQVKLLGDAYLPEELLQYRAPILAMLAQVFEVARWSIQSYTALRPVTLQNAITVQQSLMKTYDNSIPANELTWLKRKLAKSRALDRYYFRLLWNTPGENFVEIVSNLSVTKRSNFEQITTFLGQILYLCTLEEWFKVWDCLSGTNDLALLSAYDDAVQLVSRAQSMTNSHNSWLCLLYCCRNLIHIIRYKFFKEPLADNQVIAVIKKIPTLPVVKRGKPEEIESLLLPLFSYLAEKRNDYTFNLSNCDELKQDSLANLLQMIFIPSSE